LSTNESIMTEWCKNHPLEAKYHEDLLRLARIEDQKRITKEADDVNRLKEVLSEGNLCLTK
jgi:hypothetical protein